MLSDDTKRQQFDTWGSTADQMGGGQQQQQHHGFGGAHQNWNFTSSVDPEELFRKIFGQAAGFRQAGGFDGADDFAESRFGFGAAQEVLFFSFLGRCGWVAMSDASPATHCSCR